MSEQDELETVEPESQLADLPTTDEDAENVKASGATLQLSQLNVTDERLVP